ncbi:glycosyltransferase family 2 protein [Falseniella ignava]
MRDKPIFYEGKEESMIHLSIIVPVYNTAIDKLEHCFQSIKTFMNDNSALNIECVIIDDGSKDKVADWCREFSETNDGFRFYKKVNEGVSVARNFGISLSKGQYIIFVDSDDILVSFNEMEQYLLGGNYDLIFSDLATDAQQKNMWQAFEGDSREIDLETVISRIVKDEKLNGPVCKIIRKVLLDQHHIEFDRTMITGEDLVFLIHILLQKPKMYYISQCSYIYNIDTNSSNGRLKNHSKIFIANNAIAYNYILQLVEQLASSENKLMFKKDATEKYIKQLFNSAADLLEMGLLSPELKDYTVQLLSELDKQTVDLIQERKLSKANLQLTVLLKKWWLLLAVASRMRILYLKIKNRL